MTKLSTAPLRRPPLALSAALAAILCLVALAPALASAAPAKPKPSATDAVVYRADAGSEPKTIYSGEQFDLTGSCDGGRTEITLQSKGSASGEYLTTSVEGSGRARGESSASSTWDEGPVSFGVSAGEDSRQGEAIFRTGGRVVSIDQLLAPEAFGHECAFAGLVERISASARVVGSAEAGGEVRLDRGDPDYSLDCGDPDTLVASTSTRPNVLAASYLRPGVSWLGTLTRIGRDFSAVEIADFGTIADLTFTTARGRVSYLRGALFQRNSQGCSFTGAARTVAKGPARVFYATDARSPKRRTILDRNGLRLSAKCTRGTTKVYASTARKNALLRTTVFGGHEPAGKGSIDFDSTAKRPRLLLSFRRLERAGQLVYASPGGRVVVLNWSGWANAENFKRCGFTGVARYG